MDVGQLRDYIGSLESALAKKIQQQKDALEGQLAELQVTFPRRQRVLFAP